MEDLWHDLNEHRDELKPDCMSSKPPAKLNILKARPPHKRSGASESVNEHKVWQNTTVNISGHIGKKNKTKAANAKVFTELHTGLSLTQI